MKTTRWWLVRHGPVINPDKIIYGQQDIQLDESRPEIFERVASQLPAKAVWYASPLSRTMQTAKRLGGVSITKLPQVIEQDFGDWQGHRADAVDKQESHAFWECPAYLRPPRGESFTDVTGRVGPALIDVSRRHGDEDVICVCHGGSIRATLAVAATIPPETALSFRIDTLSVTRLDYLFDDQSAGQWRISGVNLAPLFNEIR